MPEVLVVIVTRSDSDFEGLSPVIEGARDSPRFTQCEESVFSKSCFFSCQHGSRAEREIEF